MASPSYLCYKVSNSLETQCSGFQQSEGTAKSFAADHLNYVHSLIINGSQHIAGPEPTVRPVRFWPDHFLLGARPLLVNAWDWHLQ